jgi:hypothetical protein
MSDHEKQALLQAEDNPVPFPNARLQKSVGHSVGIAFQLRISEFVSSRPFLQKVKALLLGDFAAVAENRALTEPSSMEDPHAKKLSFYRVPTQRTTAISFPLLIIDWRAGFA